MIGPTYVFDDMNSYFHFVQAEVDALLVANNEDVWGKQGAFKTDVKYFELLHQAHAECKEDIWKHDVPVIE